jgi:LPXTG-motif cell wall-anchored protein
LAACASFLRMILLLFVVAAVSCSGTGKPEAEALKPKANEIKKEYRKGPVCVRLSADKDAMSIAESILFTIEAEVEDGYEAELPRFGEKLGEFGIRDYREDQARLTPEGKFLARKTYTLEPFLSGDYSISPMQVRFRKKPGGSVTEGSSSNADAAWEHEITTDEITIKVNSLLEKDQKELTLNPIKGPVGLPTGPVSHLTILVGLGAAVLIAGGAFLLIKRRRMPNKQHAEPVLPPHELAYRQLQEILEENLIQRGELKLFFSKISDVLRNYIENRFGFHAPRRTTEEFLSDISRHAPFSAEHKVLLVEFLQNCDLVKFAEHYPSQEETAKAVDSCRAFIEATREEGETR